jgi:predicted TIM-barrel fold metal-dependent hydrolase
MAGEKTSRRTMLLAVGGAAAAGALGGWQAYRLLGTGSDGRGQPNGAEGKPTEGSRAKPVDVKLIDTHVHVVNVKLPGVPSIHAPDGTPFDAPVDQMAKCIRAEMKAANVEHALCMPSRELGAADPLGVEGTRRLAEAVPGLHPIGLADPERFDDNHLASVEETLKRGDVIALKAYLGYLHHGPESPGYRPYYRLAAKYQIPVIFHCGDTFSHLAKVKYAHPLAIDEVAVDFAETKFVIAHMGNPWMTDAAEVIYKNNKPGLQENVWADLSGLVVGSADDFEKYRKQGSLEIIRDNLRKALDFAERFDRIVFGSDWPLAPMNVYRDFVGEMIPQQHHQAVFHDNAKKLFRLS